MRRVRGKTRAVKARPMRRRRKADPVSILLYILLFLLAAGIGVLIYLYYSKKLLF